MKENELRFTMIDASWRANTLKKVLASGFLLCAFVALLALYFSVFYQTPIWHSWVSITFGLVLLAGHRLISLSLIFSAYLLTGTMYAGAVAVFYLVDQSSLSDFGLIFIYAIPLFARVLIGQRVSVVFKYFNLLPFTLVISSYMLSVLSTDELITFDYIYLHFLMLVFFNFILPYALEQMIQEAWQSASVRRKAKQTISERNELYHELFKASRQPSLILRLMDNVVVDWSDSLQRIIYGEELEQLHNLILSGVLSAENTKEIELSNRQFLVTSKVIQNSRSVLYVLEEITLLRQLSIEVAELRDMSSQLELKDLHTKLPSREALVAEVRKKQNEQTPTFLVCVKPEFSEHFSRVLSTENFYKFQANYCEFLAYNLSSLQAAKISRHHFAFIVREEDSETLKVRVKKLYAKLNKLQANASIDSSLLSRFSYSDISNSTCNASYLVDQTENMLTNSNPGAILVSYEPEYDDQILRSLHLRTNLEFAVERNEFTVVLQPKVSENGELTEFEALIRWAHDGVYISPAEFIPIAEGSDLICEITDWLIDRVCLFLSEQVLNGRRLYPISVNISAIDLERPDFVEKILYILNKHSVPPELLGIELTETALLRNEVNAIEQLDKLRYWGIRVSIDDFGVGYSSLSRIIEFPIDVLKLDRSFLLKLEVDSRRLVLIQSIITLCKNLNIEVVAEGVETLDELNILRSLTPNTFQGYYFSKPLEISDVEALGTQNNLEEGILFPLKL